MPGGSRAGDVVRGLWGLVRLVALVVGLPLALWALVAAVLPGSGGWPLPRALPSPDELADALAAPGQMPVAGLVKSVALVGWLAWAELSLAVVADLAARPLGRGAPRLPLPLAARAQTTAARLVASAALLSALWWSPPRPAAAHPGPAPAAATLPHPRPPSTPEDLAPGTKVYVVRPGDWLSRIAEAHLGDWHRYPEIAEANRGRPQPDGRALVDEDLIRPGWLLVMPADARGVEVVAPAARAPSDPAPVAPAVPAPEPAPSPAAPAVEEAPPISTAAPVAPGTDGGVERGAPRSPSGPGLALLAGGVGLPGIVAAAVVRKLWRERRAQQRRRRRGHDIPRPDPALEAVERRVRAVASEEALEWVDLALRYLWRALAEAQLAEPPAIEVVRVGAGGVEVLLDRPCGDIGRFRAVDGGRVWRLDAGVELEELRALAGDEGPLVPALLTVGTTPEGPVLVDLERAGTLAVEGDAERVGAFLAGAALELGTAPWSFDVPVRLLGGDARLAALELVEVVEDPEAFAGAPWQPVALDGASSTLEARLQPEAAEGFPPTVVVASPGAAPSQALARLAARARPATSGLVLVAPGPIEGARWRLRISASGAAVLEPLGLQLSSTVDGETVGGLAGLLATAWSREDGEPLVAGDATAAAQDVSGDPDRDEAGAGGGPRETTSAGIEAPVNAETSATSATANGKATANRRATGLAELVDWDGPMVGVLGPVEVPWAKVPDRQVRCEELVTFLATRDRPVPRDQVRLAVHPIRDDGRAGEVSDATFRGEVSRVRTALGKDLTGNDCLPAASRDGYLLRIPSDWIVFRARTRAAQTASVPDEEAELLRRALALVRGVPFAEVPEASFVWALSGALVTDIEVAVAEAAERLAELALAAGDPATARWAARQGLLAVPTREDLHQWWMRAAAAMGDYDDVDQAWRAACRAVRIVDPIDDPRPDTAELYRRLRGAGREGRPATREHRLWA